MSKAFERDLSDICAGVASAQDAHIAEELAGFDLDDEDYAAAEVQMLKALPNVEEMRAELEHFPETIAAQIARQIRDSGFDTSYALSLPHAIRDGMPAREIGYLTYLWDQFEVICDPADGYDNADEDRYVLLQYAINSLGGYRHLGYEAAGDIFAASERERQQVIALCALRMYVDDSTELRPIPPVRGMRASALKDDAVAMLALDHPEQFDRIRNLLDERGTANVGLVREMVESSARAVAEGML